MDEILSLKQLSISFESEQHVSHVVSNVSFSIAKGQCVGLVGESGSGKSLTALAIMQLLPQAAKINSASQILFHNRNLLELSSKQMRPIRGRKIGMIFQEALTALNPVFTIGQQIDEVLHAHFKLNKRERIEKIYTLLEEVGINETKRIAKSYPHQLSGGQRQRAMIAIALAGEPELLIADEPTTSLDVTMQATILNLVKEIQQKRNMSALFITHDLNAISKMADKVVVMQQGKVVEKADIKQFFESPQHPYSKKLFSATLKEEKQITTGQTEKSLSVKELKIHFPIRKGIFKRKVGVIKAVDGISFDLCAGRTLALVGESGSGKTTTGLGILKLEKTTSGKVDFENNNLIKLRDKKLRSLRRHMQVIFQDPYASLDPRMRVLDIISEGLVAQHILKNKTERKEKAKALLQQVGLSPEHLYRYPHEFSGGQRQRICVARALALEPKLLILDEPTSALDASVQMQVLELLKELQQRLGLTYLFITHNFAVVRYMADDVAVMYQGKIVEHGPTHQILTNPQHAYTKLLTEQGA